MSEEAVLTGIIVSNIIGALLILVCYKWPNAGRIIFGIIFFSAGIFNAVTGIRSPEVYVNGYGPNAALSIYKDFIFGYFKAHTMAIILIIAIGQLVVAILLQTKGLLVKLGSLGGIIFFIAITPLGEGSAFPAPLLMATALLLLFRKEFRKTLLQFEEETEENNNE